MGTKLNRANFCRPVWVNLSNFMSHTTVIGNSLYGCSQRETKSVHKQTRTQTLSSSGLTTEYTTRCAIIARSLRSWLAQVFQLSVIKDHIVNKTVTRISWPLASSLRYRTFWQQPRQKCFSLNFVQTLSSPINLPICVQSGTAVESA